MKDWVTQEAYDQLLLHNHQVKTNSVRMQHENHFYHLNIPQRFSRYEIGRNFCSISCQNPQSSSLSPKGVLLFDYQYFELLYSRGCSSDENKAYPVQVNK